MYLLLIGSRHKREIRLAVRLFNKSAGLFNDTTRKFKGIAGQLPILFMRSHRAHCWEGNIMSNISVTRGNADMNSRRLAAALAISLLVLLTGVATSLLSAFRAVA
jgi:hypothetical protein